jgi:enoyl-CoA hydratase/carnithine racemase
MVLAADDAVFGLPEIDTGIFPIAVPQFFSVQSG